MLRLMRSLSLLIKKGLVVPLQAAKEIAGYKIIYNPIALVKALELYHMENRIDTINARLGPIDGVIGSFNPTNGDILVDVLEITHMLRLKGNEAIDQQLTMTLAHELRHRWQFNNYNKFQLHWDRYVIFFLVHYVLWSLATGPLFKFSLNHIFGEGIFVGVLVGLAALVLTFLGLGIAGIVSYYFSWIERDARRFGAKAVSDPVWQDVFKVH